MRFIDEPASAAAMRHGRWQMLLFIIGAVVVIAAIVTRPEVFTVEEGDEGDVSAALAAMRPWSTVVVGAITAWSVFFVGLVVRHRQAIADDVAARGAFRAASWTQVIVPVLPGMLIWGRLGLASCAIGAGCLVATYVLARRGSD